MKAQKTPDNQNCPEQEEQCLRIMPPVTEKYYSNIVGNGNSTSTDKKTNELKTTCFSVTLCLRDAMATLGPL